MYGTVGQATASDAGRDPRRGPVQERTAAGLAAVGPHRGRRLDRPELLRQQLPGPGRPPRRDRGRQAGTGRLGLRDGQRPVHLRHADAARRCSRPRSASCCTPRRRSCSRPASTRTAACSRSCSTKRDAVISDELNHASLIDGIRLCKAARLRYRNRDLADLEDQLKSAAGGPSPHDRHRRRLLDGRLPRAARGDLRSGREVRRPRPRRRLARRRLRRRDRRGHAGTARRAGPRRHRHRHAGQGTRRCVRWLRQLAVRGGRTASAALAALPLLQRGRPVGRGRFTGRARSHRVEPRAA